MLTGNNLRSIGALPRFRQRLMHGKPGLEAPFSLIREC
jgi:hypothetical protein